MNRESKDEIVINIRNSFEMKKEANSDKTNSDIRNIFKQEDFYGPIRVDYLYSNNYIEYDSDGNRNKNLSIKEYLSESKSYLRDIIIKLQKYDRQKIQLK